VLLPAIVAIVGASKLNNKSAGDRKTGEALIKIAGVWAVVSVLSWATAAWIVKKKANVALESPERNGRNRQHEMMKILGLPKLPG